MQIWAAVLLLEVGWIAGWLLYFGVALLTGR